MTATLSGGFRDAPTQSARAFRGILDALSRPGTIQTLSGPVTPPAPLSQAAATLLLTLADTTTPLHLAGDLVVGGRVVEVHDRVPLDEGLRGLDLDVQHGRLGDVTDDERAAGSMVRDVLPCDGQAASPGRGVERESGHARILRRPVSPGGRGSRP